MAWLSLSAQAQTEGNAQFFGESKALFGYLSHDAALRAMPQYQQVQQQIARLRQQYESELKRAADEFNRKYEEFLEGRRDFPPTILRKRQMELQELMQKNTDFREQGRRELDEATDSLMLPLRNRLADALRRIGIQRGYALILNTDANACPYINPMMGEDVTPLVMEALRRE
jgi:outer membrane protein